MWISLGDKLTMSRRKNKLYIVTCLECGRQFKTTRANKFTCSFECKQERNRKRARCYAIGKKLISKRPSRLVLPKYQCIVCGYNEFVEFHHVIPKNDKSIVPLCPNHHRLAHRGFDLIPYLNNHDRKN